MNKLILASLILGVSALTFSGCTQKNKPSAPQCNNQCTQQSNNKCSTNKANTQQPMKNTQNNCQQNNTNATCVQPPKQQPMQTQNTNQCMVKKGVDVCSQPNLLENDCGVVKHCENFLAKGRSMTITVVGQGVSPQNTISPAQAYALAKRAAIADAYRLIAEKVKGVRVEGEDYIKNMMVQRTQIRTYVQATIRNSNIVETTFKEGLCEVEMEIKLYYSDFVPHSSYIY